MATFFSSLSLLSFFCQLLHLGKKTSTHFEFHAACLSVDCTPILLTNLWKAIEMTFPFLFMSHTIASCTAYGGHVKSVVSWKGRPQKLRPQTLKPHTWKFRPLKIFTKWFYFKLVSVITYNVNYGRTMLIGSSQNGGWHLSSPVYHCHVDHTEKLKTLKTQTPETQSLQNN